MVRKYLLYYPSCHSTYFLLIFYIILIALAITMLNHSHFIKKFILSQTIRNREAPDTAPPCF